MLFASVGVRGPAPSVVNSKDGRGPAVVVAGDLRGGPSQLNSWSVRPTGVAVLAVQNRTGAVFGNAAATMQRSFDDVR